MNPKLFAINAFSRNYDFEQLSFRKYAHLLIIEEEKMRVLLDVHCPILACIV